MQLEKLCAQIEYARKHSVYYKETLCQVALPQGMEELAALPFTPAQALRDRPEDFLCLSGARVARVTTINTSGSSGGKKRVFFSENDLQRTVDFFAQKLTTFTRAGDTVAMMLGDSTPHGLADLLCRAAENIGAQGLLLGFIKDVRETLVRLPGVEVYIGLPTQLHRLSYAAPQLRPRAVLLSADYVPHSIVKRLNQAWGCAIYQHYGLTETGFGLAVQCRALQGFHLRDQEYLLEIIEPASGQSLPPGHWGELVISSLMNEAMPLIRYRSGDLARLLPAPCTCGENALTLDKVPGRIENLRQALSIHRLDEAMFSLPGLVDYRAEGDERELFLQVESLSPPTEEQIRAALGMEIGKLQLRHAAVEIFLGPVKRHIKTGAF